MTSKQRIDMRNGKIECGMVTTTFGQSISECFAIEFGSHDKWIIGVADGAPVDGTSGSFAGTAVPGSIFVDKAGKNIYMNINTVASPTWKTLSYNM